MTNSIPLQGAVPLTNTGNAQVLDPSGNFLYVADSGGNQVLLCPVTAGVLAGTCSQAIGVTDPVGVAIDPAGQFLFILGTDGDDDFLVSVFVIDPFSGGLSPTPAEGSPYATGNFSNNASGNQQIVVDPTGKFVVVTNGFSNVFTVFSFDSSGFMVKLGDQSGQGRPQSLLFDATGTHLYEIEGGSIVINTYQFNSGALTLVGSAPVGNIPGDAAIDPTGQFFLETATADDANLTGSLIVYPIDPQTGELGEPLSTTTLGNATVSVVAVAPNITVTGTPAVTLSANTVPFPIVPMNSTSTVSTVTVTNSGNGPLTFSSIAITAGANPGDFAIDPSTTCSTDVTLAAGTSCTLAFTFTPAATGARSATATLTDNAIPATQNISLTGTGGPPLAPIVGFNPPTVTFASTALNTTSPISTVTVSNTGDAPLIFSSFAITTGANPEDFAIDPSSTCSTDGPLAPDNTCVIAFTFTPTAVGTRTAVATITNNATPAVQTITLTGTGAPTSDFTITAPDAPVMVVDGQPIKFPVTVTPSAGTRVTITFSAPGPIPVGACVFYPQPNPTTVGAPQTFNFLFTTNPPTAGLVAPDLRQWPLLLLFIFSISLVILAFLSLNQFRARRLLSPRFALFAATLLLIVLAASFSGCGGGTRSASPLVTPASNLSSSTTRGITLPGTYPIIITATSDTTSHSTTVTFVVH